jgi:hypothetical protein
MWRFRIATTARRKCQQQYRRTEKSAHLPLVFIILRRE